MDVTDIYRVNTPVCPVRSAPDDRSEQVTQYLYGEPLKLMDRHKQWCKCVSLIDEYEGWIDEKMVGVSDSSVENAVNLVEQPIEQIQTLHGLLWLPMGARVLTPVTSVQLDTENLGLRLIERSKLLMGAPYLWGGKSVLGIDCSGLTQLVATFEKIHLPRDASQQVEVGEVVDFVETAQDGDLAFFGPDEGKITHVGWVIQSTDNTLQIIHAAGEVRMDKLDHQGIYRPDQQRYTHTLRVIKRITANLPQL